ncbi:MAG: hypothetical protein P0Y56_08895 [Candidatus Andeanibacterium colombiense]|uniref:Lipoprotein n=1 Tax=Candidatus Andeanibacterium colombiense TaxID=3121345 RepID=A0AAJ5X709_9SPHN|nr:MAG: hypothetical protein P0Y56_08895 [Sphingomonadaceae bacterium]
MNNSKPPLLVLLVAAAGACLPSGCGSAEPHKSGFEEPFGFTELRQMTAPIGAMKAPDAAAVSRLQGRGPRVAELYKDALARFESIYGDGVGPARESPDFLGCKAVFRQVAGDIQQLPIADTDLGVEATWKGLLRCRKVANQWSGPAEMATFGNDLEAMTEGSMLVLSYAATASQMPAGRAHYLEAIAFDAGRKSAN